VEDELATELEKRLTALNPLEKQALALEVSKRCKAARARTADTETTGSCSALCPLLVYPLPCPLTRTLYLFNGADGGSDDVDPPLLCALCNSEVGRTLSNSVFEASHGIYHMLVFIRLYQYVLVGIQYSPLDKLLTLLYTMHFYRHAIFPCLHSAYKAYQVHRRDGSSRERKSCRESPNLRCQALCPPNGSSECRDFASDGGICVCFVRCVRR
jgi:hypothetical protein